MHRILEKGSKIASKTTDLNVSRSHLGTELRRRTPWIFLSVIAGMVMIWIGQMYEETLSEKMELVFFIPMIVYMSDCIGAETLALFVRELSVRRLSLKHLLIKESLVGFTLGVASGVPMGIFSYVLFGDPALAMTVTTTMIINGVVAVMIGMFIPVTFSKLNRDPAVGTNEINTALSDNISILVYLVVATLVLFGFPA